jgi:DNA ligase 1
LIAFASAGTTWSKEKLAARLQQATMIINQVYSELPNYSEVIPALLDVGIDGLSERCKLTPGSLSISMKTFTDGS